MLSANENCSRFRSSENVSGTEKARMPKAGSRTSSPGMSGAWLLPSSTMISPTRIWYSATTVP